MSKWKNLVKGVAPALAAGLGGPYAAMATKKITDMILGEGKHSDDDIYNALLNPDGLAKLKQIDAEFHIEMQKLGVDIYSLEVKDRDSARKLAIEEGVLVQAILTSIFVTGFFVAFGLVITSVVEFSQAVESMIAMLVGALVSNLSTIIRFWFGGGPNDRATLNNIYNSIPKEQLKK